jgi:hypothetical protein
MRAPIQVKMILEVFKILKIIWQHMQIMATSQVKMLEVCEIPKAFGNNFMLMHILKCFKERRSKNTSGNDFVSGSSNKTLITHRLLLASTFIYCGTTKSLQFGNIQLKYPCSEPIFSMFTYDYFDISDSSYITGLMHLFQDTPFKLWGR